ncbi:MAG: FUSC family protein [Candidatus Binataceae bacterium]|nr:FUSC family protein [Candidatus Binataceae bacterium]
MIEEPSANGDVRPHNAETQLRRLGALIVEELALRPHRLRTALRFASIATIGAGLMAAAHVDSPLGPYVIWLMLGAGPMLSLQTAIRYIAIEAPLLAISVPLAGIMAESPWLLLPLIAGLSAGATYLSIVWQLGSFALVTQVVILDTFYGVVFNPNSIGWSTAANFGACVISFLLIAAFDGWIWPTPAEATLVESLASSLQRMRSRLLSAANYYLDETSNQRPANPPATSEMPAQIALLNNATAEALSAHRRAVILAAITRGARLQIEIDRLTVAARESVPRNVRKLLRSQFDDVVNAIDEALNELAHEMLTTIRTDPDEPASPAAARVRTTVNALNTRIVAVRPSYIGSAGIAEISNLSAFIEGLEMMARLLERPLDEPPPAAGASPGASERSAAPRRTDSGLQRHCLKVALCMTIGYVIGLTAQRPDLSVILTTIIITALPTYGAAMRKMILRIVGTAIGGLIVTLTIITVTPNFESLPAYLIAVFPVLFISAYAALASGRTAYAGKSIGTTFLLVFAGLSPSQDIYGPLWRLWGILLGVCVVTLVFFILWPEYAGDSLLPRLRRILRDTIAIGPGGDAAISEVRTSQISSEITGSLVQILEIADDARLEGRASSIDHEAVVQAAGTLRRIAHRLGAIANNRVKYELPALSDRTERAHESILAAIRARLNSWLGFFESADSLSHRAAMALAATHSDQDIAQPLADFGQRLEADGFAEIGGWNFDQRRLLLAELQSLRRLEFLMRELDRFLARVPGSPSSAKAIIGQPKLAA